MKRLAPEMPDVELCRKTRARRLALGISQAQLARDVGIAERTLGYWESGLKDLPLAKFRRMISRLGIPAGEIL